MIWPSPMVAVFRTKDSANGRRDHADLHTSVERYQPDGIKAQLQSVEKKTGCEDDHAAGVHEAAQMNHKYRRIKTTYLLIPSSR